MPDEERSWFDTAVGAVGCAGGSLAIVVTGTATGASCAAAPTGVGAVGCGLGVAALAYEVDQTQASCRQMVTGQSTQTFGNQVLGGGYLGLGYDLAGLAGAIRKGGPELAGMIANYRTANKLGDLAAAARESGTMADFLKGCDPKDIEDLLKNGKVTAKELEAAGIEVPAGALGGNVSKAAAAAPGEVPLAGISAEEIALAKAPGDSPAQIAARKSVAKAFYEQYTEMGPERIAGHLDGIDFTKPVVPRMTEGAEATLQWGVPGNRPSNYHTQPGNSPGDVGIGPNGVGPDGTIMPKQPSAGTIPANTPVLDSTAAPKTDDWSLPGRQNGGAADFTVDSAGNVAPTAQHAPGGGPQTFVPPPRSGK